MRGYMTSLKVIIVDEERLARVNLRRLLEPFPEIEIAGEAGSCASALDLISLKSKKKSYVCSEIKFCAIKQLCLQLYNTSYSLS
jgi:DNA-binding LytR/AlgR family response regulator